MKRKKIIIVVTLAILFIVIFGVYRFIYIQTSLSEPYEEDAEIAATEIAEEEPVTEEKVQPEIEAEDADVENIPVDPLKSQSLSKGKLYHPMKNAHRFWEAMQLREMLFLLLCMI